MAHHVRGFMDSEIEVLEADVQSYIDEHPEREVISVNYQMGTYGEFGSIRYSAFVHTAD
jgi:hypothetical protein